MKLRLSFAMFFLTSFALLNNGIAARAVETRAKSNPHTYTIFKLIEKITALDRLDVSELQTLFGTEFLIVSRGESRIDYEVKNIILRDSVIKLVDFRAAPEARFLVLELEGCVSKSEVKKRFSLGPPEMNATDAGDTGIFYNAPWHRGQLSFEFLYARPECLRYVVLRIH
jgi:hypothetical protein